MSDEKNSQESVLDENKEYMEKLDKWSGRVNEWFKRHGTRHRPPIVNTKDGEPVWLNRETRRKLAKGNK